MVLNIAGGVKALEDEGVFEAADDVFDDGGLSFVVGPAADEGVEDHDEVEDVSLDLGACGFAQVKEVDDADVKADAGASDEDVVVVDVAVVFAACVDGGDAAGQGVEDVEGLEWAESATGLGGEEVAELLSVDEFGDDDDDLVASDGDELLVVVLEEDGAVA